MFDYDSRTTVIYKYYLFKAAGHPGFYLPIFVLYQLANGLTYTEIGVIGTVQAAIIVGGEIPTGYIGDRVGRRNSLLFSQVTFALGVVGFILSTDFVGFATAFAFTAFAQTFRSGSADAWLYDTLKEHLDEDTFTHVKGRGAAVRQYAMAAAMIVGSLLYVVNHDYPFFAGLVTRAGAIVLVFSMPKNVQYTDEGDDDRLTIIDALPLIREKMTKPPLRAFVAYVSLFYAVRLTVGTYVQPIAVDTLKANLGSMLATWGVPEVASLGLLYASFTGVSALASDQASRLEAVLGVKKSLIVVPLVTCLLFIVPTFVPLIAFPMFFAMRASRSLLGPIVGQYLNDHIESVGRATVLSAVSMVYSLVHMPFTVAGGVLADAFTPIITVGILGGFFLVVGTGMQLVWPPVKESEGTGATTADAAAGE